MKFSLGQIVMTRPLAEAVEHNEQLKREVFNALDRYRLGEWGNLGEEDKQANEDAIEQGERILAKYETSSEPIYIITEWDRSYTTLMFCRDY